MQATQGSQRALAKNIFKLSDEVYLYRLSSLRSASKISAFEGRDEILQQAQESYAIFVVRDYVLPIIQWRVENTVFVQTATIYPSLRRYCDTSTGMEERWSTEKDTLSERTLEKVNEKRWSVCCRYNSETRWLLAKPYLFCALIRLRKGIWHY